MNFDVLISYPHQDKAIADAACAALEADGIRCWIAPRDVAPGTEWAAAIIGALDRCRVVVLIFSSNANQSKQIYREVQRAFEQEKPVVPLRVEDVKPIESLAYYLGPVHWLDAVTPPLDEHLKRLGVAVKAFLQTNTPGADQGVGAPQPKSENDRQWAGKQQSVSRSAPSIRWLLGAGGAGVLAVAVGIAWLMLSARPPPVPPAASAPRAAAIEGSFKGTMQCDKLPWTQAPLNAAVSLSIKGGNVAFSRDVYANDGNRKIGIESGTGSLDAGGVLELTTSWVSPTSRFDGRYIGRLSATGGSLSGKQILLVDGARNERPCTIIVQKVGDA